MNENTQKEIEKLRKQISQQEKMASLGLLSAGIAHEIQNPLNFVINFSKVSQKLLKDMQEVLDELGDALPEDSVEEIKEIMSDLESNMNKIEENGNRASGIVRGILLYSRGKDDEYIPTDLHGGGAAPAAEEKAECRDEESEIHDMPPTETGRKKILVVEDHDEFRHFLMEQLQKDFCVVEARDGVEGEQAARTELPDLIVSDLMMPRMDGMELCRRLKGDIQTSHIPFILLTARSSDDSRIGGYEAGADSYISKPFNWEMLQVRIRQLIEQKERRQKMFRKSIDVSFEAITTTSIDEKLMEKALESVKKNISNPEYSVGDLSLDVGMSKTQLNRKMQAIVNVTPLQFIRSIRLKRAAQLLKATTCSVNEIADLTGFNTIKYFNLHFKEEFGMTPTQFREKEGKAQNDVTIG